MAVENEPKDSSVIQLRYALGRAFFSKLNETGERFGYVTHHIQVGMSHEDPATWFLSAGAQFSYANESSLGSQRFLANVEGGFRGFIPYSFLRLFALEVGGSVGAGWSKINFGSGDIPRSDLEIRGGLLARLLFQYNGFDIGAGIFTGASLRGYSELGLMASFSVPLQTPPVEVEKEKMSDPCKGLALLEDGVAKESEESTKLFASAQYLYGDAVARQRDFNTLRELQLQRKEYLNLQCPDIPILDPYELEDLPKPPERPHWTSCDETIEKLKAYLKDLKKLRMSLLEDSPKGEGMVTKLTRTVETIKQTHSKLEQWDVDCVKRYAGEKSPLKIVKTKEHTYRLLTGILFPNDNPDLALVPQKNEGTPAGYTEPYLDEWIRFLEQNPTYGIKIDGYASDQYDKTRPLSKEYQMQLSQDRADNVEWYLRHRGHKDAVYSYKGSPGKNDKVPPPVRIGGPFVPQIAEGRINDDQFDGKPEGHGAEDEKGFTVTYDPTFRKAKITLLQKIENKWIPVNLEEETKLYGP